MFFVFMEVITLYGFSIKLRIALRATFLLCDNLKQYVIASVSEAIQTTLCFPDFPQLKAKSRNDGLAYCQSGKSA